MVVRGRAWSFVVVRGRVWSCVVVCGRAWSCVVVRGRAPSRPTRVNETRRTRSACSTCLPRIVTSSNVSSEFALLKTTANIKSAALKTAVNNNTIDIHLTFKYGK